MDDRNWSNFDPECMIKILFHRDLLSRDFFAMRLVCRNWLIILKAIDLTEWFPPELEPMLKMFSRQAIEPLLNCFRCRLRYFWFKYRYDPFTQKHFSELYKTLFPTLFK